MISYIKEKMAMAAEFISILTEKQAEEPKTPYKKQFMDATHTLFELARHLRQINEKLSLLDKDKDITLEELKSLSCCFNDLNDAKLEPFDILLEEAMAESGLKQYTGVLRLLGIEMFAFIHEYTRHKEWYDMQCSFEHQFSLYAKKAYTDGIGKVEKILAELPAIYPSEESCFRENQEREYGQEISDRYGRTRSPHKIQDRKGVRMVQH